MMVFFCTPAFTASLHDANIQWKSIHSEHFIVHYPIELEQKAKQVDVFAEAIHQRLHLYFNWSPQEKTEITLTENALSPAAYASERPRNRIQLHLQPEHAAIQGYGNFARLLAHEYTHTLHLDKAAGLPAGFRKVFGRLNLLFPNKEQPLWFIEGMASYAADYLVAPISQGESEFFQALMRIEVNDGIKPLAQINIPVDEWPFVTTPYLYGEEWLHYLTTNYGEDSLRNLVDNYSDNLIPFFINSNSRSVYEKDLNTLYHEFNSYLQQHYGQQIAEIKAENTLKQFPQDIELPGQQGSCNSLVESRGRQYFLCSDWISETQLIQRDVENGNITVIDHLPGSGLLDAHDGRLLLIKQDWERNTINTLDLYSYDTSTRTLSRLTNDGFYVYAKWNAEATQLIALRFHHDRYTLDLLGSEGQVLKHLWQSKDNEKLSLYDFSPDGKRVLASVWRPNQYWQLEEFEVASQRWRRLYKNQSSIYNAKYSADENKLYINASFNGVPNLYRLDLSDKSLYQLTNVVGMAGSPRRLASGVYYAQADRQGYKIYKLSDEVGKKTDIEESLPTIADNEFVNPTVDKKNYDIRDYSPLPGMLPTQIVPRLNSSNQLKTIGFSTNGYDALHFHRYQFQFDHISTVSKNEYQMSYRYSRLYPTFDFQTGSQLHLYHDNSGSLTAVERSNRHDFNVVLPYLKAENRWTFYGGVKTEDFHRYAEDSNVNLDNPPSENIYGVALLFDSSKSFARSLTLSSGRSVRLVAEKSLPSSDFRGRRWQTEWREYFNLGHANVLSAKLLAGRVYDNLRAYYLGGENEAASMSFEPASMGEVLPASPFARRGFPFRGYPSAIPALTGDTMGLLSLDWTFPIARINRGWMAPPAGIRHIAGRAFVERGDAWFEHPNWLTGYGIELRMAMQLFYHQSATWRFGIAKGNAAFSETRLYHYINISFF